MTVVPLFAAGNTSPARFCRSCKWAKPFGFWPFRDWTLAKCRNPRALTLDLNVGDYLASGKAGSTYCNVERGSARSGSCGVEGTLWEARQ